MKKAMILLTAMLTSASMAMADEVTASEVTIPQGGTASVSISLTNPNNTYTAGQMVLALPEGVTAVLKANGDPTVENGERLATTNHSIGASHLGDDTEQFTIFSISSEAIAGSDGVLFSVIVTANSELTIGTELEGRLTDIEMTTTDGIRKLFNDQTFTITINEPIDPRVTLDENGTAVPEAATGVDVRVKRTIKANEWSTICLPFAMTEAQVKTAFGDDVELGDFTGYEVTDAGNSINVIFNTATTINANHPYIIKVKTAVTEFTADGVDIDPEEAVINLGTNRKPKAFIGNYIAGTTIENGCLFLNANKFWYSVGDTKIKGFRAYFDFYDLLPDFEDNYAEARVSIDFNEASGIKGIGNSELRMDNSIYDLQGRRINGQSSMVNGQLKKGLYIRNGKKEIIK